MRLSSSGSLARSVATASAALFKLARKIFIVAARSEMSASRIAEALQVKVGQLFDEQPQVKGPPGGTRRKSN